MSVKQVLVFRTKYSDGKGGIRGVRAGKEDAQLAHASNAILFSIIDGKPITDEERYWIDHGSPIVVLAVKTEEELMDVHEAALDAGLTSHLITDKGTTEFGGVPTRTVVAIGPNKAEEIDKITGHLPLR